MSYYIPEGTGYRSCGYRIDLVYSRGNSDGSDIQPPAGMCQYAGTSCIHAGGSVEAVVRNWVIGT